MKKQLCSLLTALALAVGLLPSAARAAENAPSFADVPAAAWYADAVQYVYENGLMTGVSESEFAPDGTATRGQIVTILWRLAGSPVVNYAMRLVSVVMSTRSSLSTRTRISSIRSST